VRGWEGEFGDRFEIPGFIRFLVKVGILEDLSWHNDASPSFGFIDDSRDRELRLWVSHPMADLREASDKRFGISWGGINSMEESEEFDEVQDAVKAFLKQRAEWAMPKEGTIRTWAPTGKRRKTLDFDRALAESEGDVEELYDRLFREFYSL
jgi:hypothetical protein